MDSWHRFMNVKETLAVTLPSCQSSDRVIALIFQQATHILILRFWCDVKRFDLQIALQFHLILHHQLPRLFTTLITHSLLVVSANIGTVL